MHISLTPELESRIKAKVDSGLYNNASEVIREVLRLLNENDHLKDLKRQLLQRELSVGLSSLDRGEFSELRLEDIRARVLDAQNRV